MAQLLPSEVHVNKYLTNVGVMYKNLNYIGDQIFPILKVEKESDYYPIWGKPVWFRDEAGHRAANGSAPEVAPNMSNTTYQCEEYAIRSRIPERLRANADSELKLQQRFTELLTQKIMLARERRVATAINTYTNWTSYTSLSAATYWSNYDSSDSKPVTDIDTGMAAVEDNTAGLPANTMVMGVEVWRKLRRHPEILRLCFGPGADRDMIVTPQLLARAFELERVLVGRSHYTASKEVETASEGSETYTKIWGDYCWIGHVTSTPSMLEASAGYLFRQTYKVRSWFSDDANADIFEVYERIDEKVVSAACGYLISDLIA
jgi:hypothetical protein